MTIRAAVQRFNRQWNTDTPKTRSGRRMVMIPPDAIAALRRQRVQQNRWRLAAGSQWKKTDFVFTTETGGPIYPGEVCGALRTACRHAHVLPLTPHGIRHTHASMLLSAGLPLPGVSARLGHASPDITMRIYAHAVRGADEQAAQTMQQILATGDGDRLMT